MYMIAGAVASRKIINVMILVTKMTRAVSAPIHAFLPLPQIPRVIAMHSQAAIQHQFTPTPKCSVSLYIMKYIHTPAHAQTPWLSLGVHLHVYAHTPPIHTAPSPDRLEIM